MCLPGRKFSAGSGYRYGFNGKENDKDVGEGIQDYGMRIYDARLGKFLSVDPISAQYPELTPYQFASNRPIDGIDLDGLEYMKPNSASFVLQNGVFDHTKLWVLSSNIYSTEQLIVRNKDIYKIAKDRVETALSVAEHFSQSPDSESNTEGSKTEMTEPSNKKHMSNSEKKIEAWRQNKNLKGYLKGARPAAALDALTEVKSTIDMVKSIRNQFKSDPNTNAADLNTAALAKANRLVAKAFENGTFPSKLSSGDNAKTIATDLVNYIIDFTVPGSGMDTYSRMIAAWGGLLYRNDADVMKGSFDFSPQRVVIVNISRGDTPIPVRKVVGNPNPDVNKANDFLKTGTPKPTASVGNGN